MKKTNNHDASYLRVALLKEFCDNAAQNGDQFAVLYVPNSGDYEKPVYECSAFALRNYGGALIEYLESQFDETPKAREFFELVYEIVEKNKMK
jgi:hypothetical protein